MFAKLLNEAPAYGRITLSFYDGTLFYKNGKSESEYMQQPKENTVELEEDVRIYRKLKKHWILNFTLSKILSKYLNTSL